MPTDLPDWAKHFTQGATDPGSPWRNLALGTIGLDATPRVRTVVLRQFSGRILEVHTDTRSAKYAELQANPAATLHGWDAASGIQLRAHGTSTLHVGDAVAGPAWAGLSPRTRRTYRVCPGPGSACEPSPEMSEAAAERVFCVIRLEIAALDWLHLAKEGNRRAVFAWQDGAVTAAWVIP